MAISDKKLFSGIVVSDKMNKTIVVSHERAYRHEKFQKTVKAIKKYKVHDEQEVANIGDRVEFYEVAPLSKTKYMYLHRVVSK